MVEALLVIKNIGGAPGWLSSAEHVAFDLRVKSLSPTLGVEVA